MRGVNQFFSPLEPLLVNLSNRSLTALWLVAAILVLRLLFRGAPKWTWGVLWAMLAVRLVLPFGIPAPFSVYNASQWPGDGHGSVEYFETDKLDFSVYTGEAEEPLVPADWEPPAEWEVHYPPSAVVVWLMGMVVMLLYALVSWLWLRHRVAASLPVEEGVSVCDGIGGPFILGVFRPRIYLPANLAAPRRELVLAHERAHLARRDHWWRPLGFLLLSVYWFNPVFWLCYVLFRRDIERACDERAVRGLERDGRARYAQALVDCRWGTAFCPLAFSETAVKGRVKEVLRGKEPASRLATAALCACGITAVCFLTGPWETATVSKWLRGEEDVLAYVMDHYEVDGKRIMRGKFEYADGYNKGGQDFSCKTFTVYTEDGDKYELKALGQTKAYRDIYGREWRWGPEMKVIDVDWKPLD